MGNNLVPVVLAAWIPLVVILFRAVGPRRGSLIAVVGGLLFLPRVSLIVRSIPFDKRTATGLGLLVAVACFGRLDLARVRPRWVDLPIVAYALAPLIALATGVSGSEPDVFNLMIERTLGWIIPYAIGRIYFGDADGPRQVAAAIVVGGLAYIPLCVYEEMVGPRFYLSGLIYATEYSVGMVDRLGGWRPEAFLGDGLEVALWMALATVLAAWLGLGKTWRIPRVPVWGPPLALGLATLSCRGVYGYIIMTLGLAAAFATRLFRTRAVLVALAGLGVGYMALRLTGVWDGTTLTRWASPTGRAGTVAFRLRAEDQIIQEVVSRHLPFGFGNYIWHGDWKSWPDGLWLHHLWNGGLVGLTLTFGALHLFPAGISLIRPSGRPTAAEATAPDRGLAAWTLLLMIDQLHNTNYFFPTALIAGSLVGHAASSGPDRARGANLTGHARYRIGVPEAREGVGRRLVRLGLLALALASPEWIGWIWKTVSSR